MGLSWSKPLESRDAHYHMQSAERDISKMSHREAVGNFVWLLRLMKRNVFLLAVVVAIGVALWGYKHPAPPQTPPAANMHRVLHAGQFAWTRITEACPAGTNVAKVEQAYKITGNEQPGAVLRFNCAVGE